MILVIYTDILVIGGGPAGMAAALKAGEAGLRVILVERHYELGGQLIKQTHRFFGSRNEQAGIRGVAIARKMKERIEACPQIEVMLEATAQGYYEDGVLAVSHQNKFKKITAERIIIATGASEKMLPFANNDLPGVYGAGAVQTLMNLYGVLPGRRVVMIGAGNIGLIVSYQLLQAGVEVAAVVEAAPQIGGYLVHASKIRRAGVPIYTSHTVQEVLGGEKVNKVVICQLDDNWQPLPGTDKILAADTLCLAVGLRPLVDLLIQAGCRMAYVPQLGGDVPLRDENLKTTNDRFFVAGDSAGVEEATAAILEGELAGVSAAIELDNATVSLKESEIERNRIKEALDRLRQGPVGKKIRTGLARTGRDEDAGKDRYCCRTGS